MTNKHLPIGGSTAARTLACPAWLKRNEYHKPSNRSNSFADEGNLLHDAMELYYSEDQKFEDQIGHTKYKDFTLSEEHFSLLDCARNQVEMVLNNYGFEDFWCEPFVQYETGRIGGSIDMLSVTPDGKTGLVLDYKFGKNKVHAEDNAQMKFYAMSAANDQVLAHHLKGVKRWVLVIVQPKCSAEPDIWECDNDTITEFETALLDALETPDKSQTGPHCKYCPVAPYCPDRKAEATKALILSKTSASSLGQAWQLAQDLKPWIKEVEAECQAKLTQGADIPDLKLVPGKRSRSWTVPDAELIEAFGEDIAPRVLLSPAKAEKLFGKDSVMDYAITTEGNLTVAHITDKREGIVIDVEKSVEKIVAKTSTMFNN